MPRVLWPCPDPLLADSMSRRRRPSRLSSSLLPRSSKCLLRRRPSSLMVRATFLHWDHCRALWLHSTCRMPRATFCVSRSDAASLLYSTCIDPCAPCTCPFPLAFHSSLAPLCVVCLLPLPCLAGFRWRGHQSATECRYRGVLPACVEHLRPAAASHPLFMQ